MNNTIEITALDGTSVEVEFERMGPVERMRTIAKAPPSVLSFHEGDGLDPQMIDYFADIITSKTDLNNELLDEISMVEFARLIAAAAQVLADEPIDVDVEKDEPEPSFDLNDDGAVDLEDWR